MSRSNAALFALVFIFFFSLFQLTRLEYSITERPSEFNRSVLITQNFRGIRFMRFGDDSTVQSFYDTWHPQRVISPYVQVSLQALKLEKPVRRVLVVGMGGGVMGMAARRAFPDAWIDLVDIDPVVVDLARDFMGFRSDSRMFAHAIDGAAFVRRVQLGYDLIFLDAFNGSDPPQDLITEGFFRSVAASLASGGLVVSNVVYRDVSPFYDEIIERMQKVFGTVRIATVPGGSHNRVIFAPSL